MKNLNNIIALLFLAIYSLNAQTPQKMTYQAVIRDATGQLLKDRNIGMQISVLSGSESGTPVFVERFFPSTNSNGLVTVEIGGGLSVNGSFAIIDWKTGPYFVKTETDINGGANYTLTAKSQLLSVPYALMAKNVENVPSLKMDDLTDVNSSGIQAGQLLKWNGTEWVPSNDVTGGGNGPTYTQGTGIAIDVNNVISNTGDLSNTNEIQQLELAGNQLKLTGANTVTLPTGTTYTAGSGISLANNIITNTGDNDNNVSNELQQLTLSGTVLTLSQNGGSVTLPTSGGGSGDNWGTQTVVTDNTTIEGQGTPASPLKLDNQNATNGQVLKSNGNTWLPGADNDNQNLSIAGNQLSISNGNSVSIPPDGDGSATNEIQTLSLNGQTLSLSQGGGSVVLTAPGDNWGTQTANVQSHMTGNGTSANPIGIANGGIAPINLSTTGATLNDTYVFNGNAWVVRKPVNITTNATSGLEVLPVTGEPLTFQIKNKLWTNFTEGDYYMNLEKMSFGAHSGSGEVLLGSNCKYHSVLPSAPDFRNIGRAADRWDKIFVNTVVGGKSEGDWLPSTNGTVDLGSTSFEWDKLYANTIVGPANLESHLIPVNGSQSDLGSSSKKFRDIYANSLILGVGNLEISSSLVEFICGATFRPDANNSKDLGSTSQRWKKIYTNTAVDVGSDKRLKENIKPISFGLNEIMKIKPVSYTLIDDKNNGQQLGYLAQDLKKVIPSVVHGDENKEMLSVTYTELIPVLTRAIQEQQVMIDDQNKKIEALIKKMEALENK